MAGLVKVPAAELAAYAWSGRTIKYHRSQIRDERGFREVAGEDEQRMVERLAGELCPVELSVDRLREDLLARFQDDRIAAIRRALAWQVADEPGRARPDAGAAGGGHRVR